MTLVLLRIDPAQVLGWVRRPRAGAGAVRWVLVACPLIGLRRHPRGRAGRCARVPGWCWRRRPARRSPPRPSPGWSGWMPRSAWWSAVATTALLPFTAPPLALGLLGLDLAISVGGLMLRLLLIVGLPAAGGDAAAAGCRAGAAGPRRAGGGWQRGADPGGLRLRGDGWRAGAAAGPARLGARRHRPGAGGQPRAERADGAGTMAARRAAGAGDRAAGRQPQPGAVPGSAAGGGGPRGAAVFRARRRSRCSSAPSCCGGSTGGPWQAEAAATTTPPAGSSATCRCR